MSFTDLYYKREEKRVLNHSKELLANEIDSNDNFSNIFNALQELRCVLERSLEDDEEILHSLGVYGDEFYNDAYSLLEQARKFERKYEKLY